MQLVAKLDHYGKPAWITVMVLGFVIFWPIGLGILIYLLWSGRMGCWKHSGHGRWHNERRSHRHGPFGRWREEHKAAPSTNGAFEDYRQNTLRRLEEEEREFHDYLERLRQAKDKQEFDQFMGELKSRPPRDDEGDRPAADTRRDGDAPQPQS